MPGIAGIIAKREDQRYRSELAAMLKSMLHEPYYTSGSYHNGKMGFHVAWACHKDSFADCMPITNETQDKLLFFAGENHADRKVAEGLVQRGHACNPANASYLIHFYEEAGEGFFSALNGWFGGLLVDIQERRLVIFNDRYSMHRIYYYEDRDAFYFASEAKALLSISPELRRIDEQGLAEFLTAGCTMENRSIFSKVRIMPGGSAWQFVNGALVQKASYFTFDAWENQEALAKEVFCERLIETFREILPRYLDPKEQVALSLTGGLDTRLIMTYMDREPFTLPCYTFGGMYRDCYDVKIAREVAAVCQQSHRVLRIGRDFLEQFPALAERTVYIADGNLDVGVSHEIYLNGMARTIAPIRLTGNYGSEVLRGVNFIRPSAPASGVFHAAMAGHFDAAFRTFDQNTKGNKLSYAVCKLIPWHLYGRLSAAQSQLTVRAPYMDNDLVQLMYRAPVGVLADDVETLRLISRDHPVLAKIATDRGLSIGKSSISSTFEKLYREITFKAEYFYGSGLPHWLARYDDIWRGLQAHRMILGRHKIEQYRLWFRDELAAYFREMLLDPRSLARPYLNRPMVEQVVMRHTRGDGNYTEIVNKLLTMELVHRQLIEAEYH